MEGRLFIEGKVCFSVKAACSIFPGGKLLGVIEKKDLVMFDKAKKGK